MRSIHALTTSLLALAFGPARAQQSLPGQELAATVSRHARAVLGATLQPPAHLHVQGTMTTNDGHRSTVQTWVRRKPFAFRRQITPPDPAQPPIVMVTDGRYAWDAEGRPLAVLQARLCFEAAFVDGLLYLDPRAITGGPDTREPWHLRDHGDLPATFRTDLRTNWVGSVSPAGTMLQLHFGIGDDLLHEVAVVEQAPAVTWTRYGDWKQCGDLLLPRLQVAGVLGHPVRTVYELQSVETPAAMAADLFGGCPRPPTSKLQHAGRLQLLPHTVPGSASLVLPEVLVEGRRLIAVADTGATRTAVAPEVADALQLPFRRMMSFAALTRTMTAPIAWVDTLRLGDRRELQLQVGVMRLPSTYALAGDRQDRVLVGTDVLFADSPVFDLAQGELLCRGAPVVPLSELEPQGRIVLLPLVHDAGGSGFVDIEVNGVVLRALLDTGMPHTLRLGRRALARCGLPTTAEAWMERGACRGITVEAGGKQSVSFLATLPAFRLGAMRHEGAVVDLGSLVEGAEDLFEVIVGAGAWLPFARVGIDLERGRLELECRQGAAAVGDVTVPAAGAFLGFELRAPAKAGATGNLGLPSITAVWAGSPAARAGVAVGDLLARVDGVECEGGAMGEVNRRLWLPAGRAVEIELVGAQGERRTVRLP